MKRYRTIIYITSIVILLFGIITTGKRIYIDSTKYKLYNITLLTINNKTIVNKPKLLTIEEIKNSNGLLMSITSSKDEKEAFGNREMKGYSKIRLLGK